MATDGTQTFGEKMRALMNERGISLRALARTTHYDPGYLSKVANDKKRPSRQLIDDLAPSSTRTAPSPPSHPLSEPGRNPDMIWQTPQWV